MALTGVESTVPFKFSYKPEFTSQSELNSVAADSAILPHNLRTVIQCSSTYTLQWQLSGKSIVNVCAVPISPPSTNCNRQTLLGFRSMLYSFSERVPTYTQS